MAVEYHKYYLETSADPELYGTTRHLFDVMLGLSRLDNGEIHDHSVSMFGKLINRSQDTARFHLHKLINMGYVDCYFQKDKNNPKWNIESVYVVHLKRTKPYKNQLDEDTEQANGIFPSTPPEFFPVPPLKNSEGKESLEGLREDFKDTLKREAPLPKNLSNTDQTTETPEALTTPATPVSPESPVNPEEAETPKASNQVKSYDLSGVPDIMHTTAEYFLLKTGKTSLTAKDVEAFCELSKAHMPVRVEKEINTAIERFQRDGRSLDKLHMGYIAACLSHQQSYDPDAPHTSKKKRARRNKQATNPPAESATVQESAPELAAEILPVAEAERVISEYTPATSDKNDEIPVALQELYERMNDHEEDKRAKRWEGTDEPFTLEDYLRLKFPEAEEEELRRDYDGEVHETYDDFPAIGRIDTAFGVDFACAFCTDPKNCALPEGVRKGHEYPVAELFTNEQGQRCLGVKYEKCLRCKHRKTQEQADLELVQELRRGGLSEALCKQTFTAYEHDGMPPEIVSVKAKAILAAKNHTNLILAGKPGTGKTHLATAIAIEAIREGKRAIVVTVPEMLDELRQAAHEHTDFLGHLMKYKEVACLVLDDWGKEKTTQAGLDYLYQIIDYRYRRGMQTIATTNALDMGGLMNPWNADKIEPLVSRLLENGEWITIRSAENHRLKVKTAVKAEMPTLPAETVELYGKIQAREAEITAKCDAYFAQLPKDENDCYVFPDEDDMTELSELTFEDYLHMKFPEAKEEELRTDSEGNVHEDYSEFAEYRKMERAFRVDKACATCINPEECRLPDGICKGLRYPTIVRQTTPHGKGCIGIKYEEHLECKHKCANCPKHEAVTSEKTQMPETKAAQPEAIAKSSPQPVVEGIHGGIASEFGMRQSFDVPAPVDTADTLIPAEEPEREKCHSLEEMVSYRMKHGKMPPEYEGLGMYDKQLVAMRIMEQMKAETAQPETPKKPERNPLYDDEDFWKEDEDEYRLPGDEPKIDYDDPAMATA